MPVASHLTARELEMLHLVIAGCTNRANACKLFISEKTVEFHLDHIHTKIGARTCVMAIV